MSMIIILLILGHTVASNLIVHENVLTTMHRMLSASVTVNIGDDSVANATACDPNLLTSQGCNLRSAIHYCELNDVMNCDIYLATDTLLTFGELYVSNAYINAIRIMGNGSTISSSGTKCLRIERNATSSVTLEHIIFAGCGAVDGGAIDISGSKLSHVYFINITAVNNGHITAERGAISIRGCTSFLSNCVFMNNTAVSGAAAYFSNSEVSIFGGRITANMASGDGGAVYVLSSNVTISDSALMDNYAAGKGGGLSVSDSHLTLSHSHIENCSSLAYGGGIYSANMHSVSLSKTSIALNSASYGGGVYITHSANPMLDGCNIAHNSAVRGGGLYIHELNNFVIINETRIFSNEAQEDGGGVYMYQDNDHFWMLGAVIASNSAGRDGGGVYYYANNNLVNMSTSHIISNSAGRDGGGLYVFDEHVSIAMVACQLWFNRAAEFGGGIYLGAHCLLNTTGMSVAYNIAAIDGGGLYVGRGNGLVLSEVEWLSNVAIESGGAVAVASYIQHIHINNCKFEGNYAGSCGGAVHFVGSNRYASLCNNAFVDNYAVVFGGGVYVGQSSHHTFLSQNTFSFNYGSAGGGGVGVTFATRNITIEDSTFVGNIGGRGAGVMLDKLISDSTLRNLTFQYNQATFYGGGGSIGTVSRDIRIVDCFFDHNTAAVYGGGFHVNEENYDVSIESSHFIGNSARYGGAVTFLQGNQRINVTHVMMRANSATLNGGGVFLLWLNEGIEFSNVLLQDNIGAFGGGGIYVSPLNYYINVFHSLFIGNAVYKGDGGAICTFADVVTFSNSTLKRNSATTAGGAYIQSAGLTLRDMEIDENVAESIGGLHLSTCSNVLLQNVLIRNNNATIRGGGGMTIDTASNVNITRCSIENNFASESAGMHISATVASVILHSTFTNNTASIGAGGGLTIQSCSDTTLAYSRFFNNIAATDAGAVSVHFSSDSFLDSCVFDGNTAVTGSGGAITIVESKPTEFIGNVIRNCTAFGGGGGGVWWKFDDVLWRSPIGLSDTLFYNNAALYGNDAATNAMQLGLLDDSALHVQSYATPLADVRVNFLDYYYSIDKLASDYVVEATSNSINLCGSFSGQVHGGTIVESLNGTALFRQLFASCYPGGSMTVRFKAALDYKTVYVSRNITFRGCMRGEYYSDGACVVCPAGTYSILANSDNSITTCNTCPSAASHCIGNVIVLRDKYWRLSNLTSTIHDCPYPAGCAGGLEVNEASCKDGYEGPLCAVCSNGYYFETSTSSCDKCPSGGLNIFGVVIVAIIGCLLSIPVFVLTLRFAHSSTGDTIITNLSCGAILFMIYVRCVALRRPMTEKERIEKEDAWSDFFVRLQPKLKIYVSLIQILSALPFVLNVSFPPVFSSLLNIGSLLNINFAAALGVTCYGSFDYIDYLVMTTLIPILLSIVLFAACAMHTSYMKYRLGASESTLTVTIGKYLTLFLIGTFLVLPGVSVYIFRVFSCHDIDPEDDNPGEDIYMRADYSISCVSDRYYFGRVYAIIMIFVYPVGIPLFYFILLYSRRKYIRARDSESLTELCLARMKPLSFLYSSYEPQYWYWEIIETFRRILLTGVLVLVAQGSALQIVVGLIVAMIYIKLYSYCAPFSDPLLDTDMEFVQYQLFAVLFVTLLMSQDLLTNVNPPYGGILLAIVLSIMTLPLWRHVRQRQHRSNDCKIAPVAENNICDQEEAKIDKERMNSDAHSEDPV